MKISLSRALKAGLAIGAAVMALAGCATTGDGAAQMSAQWTGKDAAAVQAAWGHADEKTSLADGSEVLTYHRTKQGTVGDQAVTVRRDNTEYDQQGGTNLSRQVPYNAPQYDPNLAVAAKCDASFTLKGGVVASAVFKGGCG